MQIIRTFFVQMFQTIPALCKEQEMSADSLGKLHKKTRDLQRKMSAM